MAVYQFAPRVPAKAVAEATAQLDFRRPCGGPWWPHYPTPKQHAFLWLPHREALFGGAVGGGKSQTLLTAALQYVCVPGYAALLLRESFPQLAGPGGLIDRAHGWLDPLAEDGLCEWNEQRHRWTFPSGATLTFGYAKRVADRYKFQGLEVQYAGFDELTHWPDSGVYTYVGFSRVRGPASPCATCQQPLRYRDGTWRHASARQDDACGDPRPASPLPACPVCGLTLADVPLRTRSGTNPGGRGHAWVRQRFVTPEPTDRRVYLPATLDDNPFVDRDEYVEGLQELDPVERAQLIRGDWEVRESGLMFQRDWLIGDAA